MTHIPIMVKIVDEVVSSAAMERETSNEVITSCHTCGGIYFYQVIEHIIGTQIATDTMIYCCQCGQSNGEMFNDPVNELDEKMQAKKRVKGLKKDIALIKMLKALDNDIRLAIIEGMLNTLPTSRTYIHKLVEEVRGKTSKGFVSYHLDILIQGGVVEKIQEGEYALYHITRKAIRTLESLGLMEVVE